MKIYPMLIANTDHLIFLSSYRVYADEQHPITEEAPRLYDVIKDPEFLETEDYSVPKCKVEDFLSTEHPNDAWTVVRPVISFSQRRMDLLLYSGRSLMAYAAEGKEILMPEMVRNFGAGLDWAGNSGKLIANLLFKKEAIGERFSVYSGHGLTWGDVAQLYTDIIGLKVRWCSEEEFVANTPSIQAGHKWAWPFDRRFDRSMDASKVLRVTGLTREDFGTIRDGILTELALIEAEEKAK